MSVRPRRSTSLPPRGDFTSTSITNRATPKENVCAQSAVRKTAIQPLPLRKLAKKPDEDFCEITGTRAVRGRRISPVLAPTKPPDYTPFRPSSITYEYGRSPVRFRLAPGKPCPLTFEEFKETHLSVKRPSARIECVDLNSEEEEEVTVPTAPEIKRQNLDTSPSGEVSFGNKIGETSRTNKTKSAVTSLEVRPPPTNHIKPAPEIPPADTIVQLAATPSPKESASVSISSPEMYRKIRNWLILYVNDHMDAFSESYWATCNQALKEDLGIPVHKGFLHIMWDQICKSLAVVEAKKMRQALKPNVENEVPKKQDTAPPETPPQHRERIESRPSTSIPEDRAQHLKRKASVELIEQDRMSKLVKSSPNNAASVKIKSEEDTREKLFLNMLSSTGSSPASSETQSSISIRALYPTPKDIHKKLLTLFTRPDYTSNATHTGRELTVNQAQWLIAYEIKNAPPKSERKPNGYWNTVTELFNSRFPGYRDKKSLTDTTARLMRHFEEDPN